MQSPARFASDTRHCQVPLQAVLPPGLVDLVKASVRLCGASIYARALGLDQALRGRHKSTHTSLDYLLVGVHLGLRAAAVDNRAPQIKRRDPSSAAHAPVCSPPDHQHIYLTVYSSYSVLLQVEWDAQLS